MWVKFKKKKVFLILLLVGVFLITSGVWGGRAFASNYFNNFYLENDDNNEGDSGLTGYMYLQSDTPSSSTVEVTFSSTDPRINTTTLATINFFLHEPMPGYWSTSTYFTYDTIDDGYWNLDSETITAVTSSTDPDWNGLTQTGYGWSSYDSNGSNEGTIEIVKDGTVTEHLIYHQPITATTTYTFATTSIDSYATISGNRTLIFTPDNYNIAQDLTITATTTGEISTAISDAISYTVTVDGQEDSDDAILLPLSITGSDLEFAVGSGDGSSADSPYLISTCRQLQNMQYHLTSYFQLTQDIDCSSTASWSNYSIYNHGYPDNTMFEGDGSTTDFYLSAREILHPVVYFEGDDNARIEEVDYTLNTETGLLHLTSAPAEDEAIFVIYDYYQGFRPIGTCGPDSYDGNCKEEDNDENYSFNGQLDGSGYKITNLLINRPYYFGPGLFGMVGPDAEIKDVGLDDVYINGYAGVGALAGMVGEGAIIDQVYAVGTTTGQVLVGGLVGYNVGGLISRSYTTGAVISNYYYFNGDNDIPFGMPIGFGGLVGWNVGGVVSSSYSNANLSGFSFGAGGLVGINQDGRIINTYATGNVAGFYVVGGLVGINSTEGLFSIINSYATGNVTGIYGLGGLAGLNIDDDIQNSFAVGSVATTTIPEEFGGEDPGDASLSLSMGGLVGVGGDDTPTSSDLYTNNYWFNNLEKGIGNFESSTYSGKWEMASSSDYFKGNSTIALFTAGTPVWDFTTPIWVVNTTSYPTLYLGSIVCPQISHAVSYNNYPTCGVLTCDSGYTLSDDSCVVEDSGGSGGGAPITMPSGVGQGAGDVAAPAIGGTLDVGTITTLGTNVLTYITNLNNFLAPESGNGWRLGGHTFQITNLDLANFIATITFNSNPVTITIKKGESQDLDLDGDKKNDIKVTFANTYVNRAEITIASLTNTEPVTINTTNKSSVVTKFIFKKNLSSGMVNNDVKELQKYLNTHGFVVAKSGAGSPGHETTKFGAATRTALIKFQKAKGIKPANGLFGPLTRGVVNK